MNKRFFMIQIIVFILLTTCLVGVTYSWSTRPAVKGGFETTPMTLNYTTVVNGNQCTAKTYQGSISENGDMSYSETEITNLATANRTAGTVLYFRTVVTNASNTVDTNVSLLVDVNYTGNVTIGSTFPAIKKISYNATNENKWIPVVSQYEVKAAQNEVYIDWYVEITTTSNFGIEGFALANN